MPTWELRFAEAGRRCRRGPAGANQADGVAATDATGTAATTDMAVTDATGTAATTDMAATDPADPAESTDPADTTDAVRVLLLHTARADTDTLARLYRQGTAAERRAVLLSLPHLLSGPEALSLTEDALRTNDTRLVAAAVGPYAADHLDAHTWRHAVLKCLFTGVPVDAVAALEQRARGDAELARMLRDYAAERTAAGRPVPGDLHRVLALTELSAEDTPRKES
ncbi:EboA domain-containing protein [Streptomyces sp. NPDC002851]